MLRAALSFTALAALVTGCISERDYATIDPASVDQSGSFNGSFNGGSNGLGSNLQVNNGRVRGDIGAVRNFDAAADQVDAWYDADWQSTSITLTANDPQERMGMFILELDGVDLRAVNPGTYHYSAQSLDPNVDGGYLSVTGCSSDPNSYYDEPGQDGTVTITETPAGRQVEVQSTLPVVLDDGSYASETSTATGSFTLQ